MFPGTQPVVRSPATAAPIASVPTGPEPESTAPTTPTEPPSETPSEPAKINFTDLFLAETEVPQGMLHLQSPSPEFNEAEGFVFGFSFWMNPNDGATMSSFFDLRWVFDSEEQARAFIQADPGSVLAEGYPELHDVQTVGTDGRVFGGTSSRTGLVAYIYVFRVGPIVVKNFSGQGERAASPLTPIMLIPYEDKVIAKLEGLF